MEKEIMPLYSFVMIEFYDEDPYDKKYTESGLKLTEDVFENPDTGNLDKKEFPVKTAKVIDVGPDAKFVRQGDDVMVDSRTCRPIRFMGNIYFIVGEQNIITVIAENLKERLNK